MSSVQSNAGKSWNFFTFSLLERKLAKNCNGLGIREKLSSNHSVFLSSDNLNCCMLVALTCIGINNFRSLSRISSFQKQCLLLTDECVRLWSQSAGNDSSTDPRRHSEVTGQEIKVNTHSHRNSRRGGYARNSLPGNLDKFEISCTI